jgi:hypothetical protein
MNPASLLAVANARGAGPCLAPDNLQTKRRREPITFFLNGVRGIPTFANTFGLKLPAPSEPA